MYVTGGFATLTRCNIFNNRAMVYVSARCLNHMLLPLNN